MGTAPASTPAACGQVDVAVRFRGQEGIELLISRLWRARRGGAPPTWLRGTRQPRGRRGSNAVSSPIAAPGTPAARRATAGS